MIIINVTKIGDKLMVNFDHNLALYSKLTKETVFANQLTTLATRHISECYSFSHLNKVKC